ncbi:MAG: 50S ribosomal protein L29 [Alphaproteobacteria bacterium]|nr:50S ribosomal protein L29 [Alphaproteobacteria bacterium]
MVKVKDLRAKSDAELNSMVQDLNKEALSLRFSQATGQLANTARRRQVRREIAQIKTILTERQTKKGE